MTDTENSLRAITPEWGQRHVAGTIAGDPDSALCLFSAMDDATRGKACRLLLWEIPASAYRTFLAAAWGHSHRHVITAAWDVELYELFEYADFPVDHLPETFRVWRGASALTPEQTSVGNSWTTTRDAACWFAMRFADGNGSPVVLAADIQRWEVSYTSNERQESEILLMDPPENWWIDGDTADWAEGCTRYEGAK
jgi:hypothetical protein